MPERMLDIIVELSQPAAMLRVVFWSALAAAGEIAGCSAFYAWLRLGRSPAAAPRLAPASSMA